MGSDMAVALGPATANGRPVFGHNSHRPAGECQRLVRVPGREFALGEVVATRHVKLPQVRQTFTVLASQPGDGWGYQHGLNEHQVAIGCSAWSSRLTGSQPGLAGTELVRLLLERCRSARQAVALLTDLVVRYGQGSGTPTDPESDHLFLLADPSEAFVVEAAGNSWALQQIHEARAAGAVGVIRQDWDRIAPGLADRLAALGWWECDGSKLDFVGSLSAEPAGRASALRRWGRATFLLEQQSGRIDVPFLRRLLADHYDGTRYAADPARDLSGPVPLCRHALTSTGLATGASLVAELVAGPSAVPVGWCAFGPPCVSAFFPIFLDGELPAAFGRQGIDNEVWRASQRLREFVGGNPERWQAVRDTVASLQARFDHDAEEFTAEAAAFRQAGRREEQRRLAGLLMQAHVEQFQDAVQSVLAAGRRSALSAAVTGF
jgi:secernin